MKYLDLSEGDITLHLPPRERDPLNEGIGILRLKCDLVSVEVIIFCWNKVRDQRIRITNPDRQLKGLVGRQQLLLNLTQICTELLKTGHQIKGLTLLTECIHADDAHQHR